MPKIKNSPLKLILILALITILVFLLFLFFGFPKISAPPIPNPSLHSFNSNQETRTQGEGEPRMGNDFKESEAQSQALKKSEVSEIDKDIVNQRRMMAKMSLASMYTTLKAYQAEYRRYSSDLTLMGYSLEGMSMGKKIIPIKLGFLSPFQPKTLIKDNKGEVIENPLRMNTDTLMKEDPEYKYEYHEDIENVELEKYQEYCEKGCRVQESGFEIMAVFPYPNQRGFEVWTMNDQKVIFQKKLDFK